MNLLVLILVVILLLALFGGHPLGVYSGGYGRVYGGGIGTVLIIVLVLFLLGVI